MSESLPIYPQSNFVARTTATVESQPKTKAAALLRQRRKLSGRSSLALLAGAIAAGLMLVGCQPATPPLPPPPTISPKNIQVSPTDGMTMLFVPAGPFKMGSDTDASEERPAHTVTLDAFWIDRTEVTNAMFRKFLQATNYPIDAEQGGTRVVFNTSKKDWEDTKGADWQHPRGPSSNIDGMDDYPVVQVNWNDATAYCKWAGRRLPTEAEWEKAARGTDGRTFPWGSQTPTGYFLNFADRNLDTSWATKDVDDGYQFTSPVGHYPFGVSPYGALDMAGNVWEWVSDWYSDAYYANSPAENPQGPAKGAGRSLRGGAWNSAIILVRITQRGRNIVQNRADSLGFRCALTP